MLPLLFINPDGSICRMRPQNKDGKEPFTIRPLLCSSVEGRRCCIDCATFSITYSQHDEESAFVATCGSRKYDIGTLSGRYLDHEIIREFLPGPDEDL